MSPGGGFDYSAWQDMFDHEGWVKPGAMHWEEIVRLDLLERVSGLGH
jgi:hypothetical protein